MELHIGPAGAADSTVVEAGLDSTVAAEAGLGYIDCIGLGERRHMVRLEEGKAIRQNPAVEVDSIPVDSLDSSVVVVLDYSCVAVEDNLLGADKASLIYNVSELYHTAPQLCFMCLLDGGYGGPGGPWFQCDMLA